MEYGYLQGMDLDVPLIGERNLCGSSSGLGSFQNLPYSPLFPPMSWSTTDPTLLQVSEQQWFSRVKIPPADNIGVDVGGRLTCQSPNIVTHNSQLNLHPDMMSAAINGDLFSFGGDVAGHAQWMQMCSLSSDEYFNDAMPELISDSAAQHPCMYTSSGECLNEAESSGSSERERPLSRSCLVSGSSSEEINWRNSDVLLGNLEGSVTGFPTSELHDDSSSVVADLHTLESSEHAVGSHLRMPGTAVACLPLRPVSWMTSCAAESGSSSVITTVVKQHVTSMDPPHVAVTTQSSAVPPSKRQRARYTMENTPSVHLSHPLIPSLSRSISAKSPRSETYEIASSHITDGLCTDFDTSRRQIPWTPKLAAREIVAGFALNKDMLHHDPRSHRKQNATSIEPQSVAARHRRKKITERVRVLEKLIPGGNKMDTASMLDESIEYVKFLQLQVQLLESLGDMSQANSTTTLPFYKENSEGTNDGFDKSMSSFGSHTSQICGTTHKVRPAASPLILSEILQQQLFKQKLCLVSLRQCPRSARFSTSGSYA